MIGVVSYFLTAVKPADCVLRAGAALALVLCAACSSPAPEAEGAGATATVPGFVPDTKPAPPVRWVDSEVPGGTPLKLVLIQPVAAATSRQGDRIEARVTEAVVVGDLVAVPSGSIAHGVVVESLRGSMAPGGVASLTILFERLSTPTGAGAPMRARYRQRGPEDVVALKQDALLTVMLEQPMTIQVKQ